jgi:hypothetical protein
MGKWEIMPAPKKGETWICRSGGMLTELLILYRRKEYYRVRYISDLNREETVPDSWLISFFTKKENDDQTITIKTN